MVDLVDSDKSGCEFELQMLVYVWVERCAGLTILFLSEMTMNWAFLVRSLIYEATMETYAC